MNCSGTFVSTSTELLSLRDMKKQIEGNRHFIVGTTLVTLPPKGDKCALSPFGGLEACESVRQQVMDKCALSPFGGGRGRLGIVCIKNNINLLHGIKNNNTSK
jgi:hypothetical protein